MARYLRTTTQSEGHSRLSAPAVVNAQSQPSIVYYGPGIRLTNPRDRRPPVEARLKPPTIINPPIAFSGPRIKLVTPRGRDVRAKTYIRLIPPAVISAAIVYRPTEIKLTYSRRGKPKSTLFVPVVVLAQSVSYRGILCKLTYSKRGRQASTLKPPIVIGAGIAWHGPGIKLTNPRDKRPKTRLELNPPQVVNAAAPTVVYFGPEVKITYSRRGKAKSELFGPAIIGPGIVYQPLETHLAYSRRGKPKSKLFVPRVVYTAVELSGPEITLAPSKRGKPKSRLFPPIIPPLAPPVEEKLVVQLSRVEPRVFQLSRLSKPAVIGAGIVYPGILGKLVPVLNRVPLTKKVLAKPIVIGSAEKPIDRLKVSIAKRPKPQTRSIFIYPIVVQNISGYLTTRLAPPPKPKTRSTFIYPIVVFKLAAIGAIGINLAPQARRGGRIKLLPPVVVNPAVATTLAIPSVVRLTKRPRIKTRYELVPPAVIGAGIVYRPVQAHLAYSRRGKQPKSHLNPPVVVRYEAYFGPEVKLTPSKRGIPKSELRPPVVIGAGIFFRGILKKVTYSVRKPGRATVFPGLVGRDIFFGPITKLTYSRRGKAKPKLKAPAVIGAGIVFRGILVKFVPGARGQSRYDQKRNVHSRLRPPVVLRLQEQDLALRRLSINLTYSVRKRGKTELAPPQVVRIATEIYGPEITLAPSKRGKPKFELFAPTVIGKEPFRKLLVNITYSRRGIPKSRLNAPTVVNPFVPPTPEPVAPTKKQGGGSTLSTVVGGPKVITETVENIAKAFHRVEIVSRILKIRQSVSSVSSTLHSLKESAHMDQAYVEEQKRKRQKADEEFIKKLIEDDLL